MGFRDKRERFFEIRKKVKIIVRYHAYKDYPEREFSAIELENLVRDGKGRISNNNSPEAIPESFLFFPKDDDERECKLVLLLEEILIEHDDGTIKGETIIVCSAYRKV